MHDIYYNSPIAIKMDLISLKWLESSCKSEQTPVYKNSTCVYIGAGLTSSV